MRGPRQPKLDATGILERHFETEGKLAFVLTSPPLPRPFFNQIMAAVREAVAQHHLEEREDRDA